MISKENAEHYFWGEGCEGWHLVKTDQLSVIQERMPPGASEVRHFHVKAQQFFFILSGTATIEIGGEREVLAEHEGVAVAYGIPHQVFNHSAEELEFIVISKPPSHEDRVVVA